MKLSEEEIIIKRLKELEKEYGFEIILAVESGSRGWGFASSDADYDIRFVYKYPLEKYLSIKKPKSCVNLIEGDLDFEGYDIYKFYDLLYKSNMNIIDWLMQDIIYVDKMKRKYELILDVKMGFDRRTYVAHNYGLMKQNYYKYFIDPAENEPTVKRYIYCLKALLSAKYCQQYYCIAPLKFDNLVEKIFSEEEESLKKKITELVELKKKTKEKQRYVNPFWEDFIERGLKKQLNVEGNTHEEQEDYLKSLNSSILFNLTEENLK